jgi:hypothetical protein
MSDPSKVDAYRHPQQVRPGCTHQLGCRCTAPYWLRPSTPEEERRENFLRRPFLFPTTPDSASGERDAG